MNLAKVTSARQVTVPIDVYNFLGLKPGDKLLFMEKKDGNVIISNASNIALAKAQKSFRGVGEKIGVKTDDDVINMVREIRYGEE